MNAQFRNPPPGGNDPLLYDDPVTVPAADIAENPYWKRDVRRSYPKLSVVNQGDVVGLLTVGSAAQPKDDVLKLGEAGSKQLVEVKEEGSRGLSTYFQSQKDKGLSAWKAVAGPDGLPPTPSSMHLKGKAYKLTEPDEQTYGGKYVYTCVTRERDTVLTWSIATRAGRSYRAIESLGCGVLASSVCTYNDQDDTKDNPFGEMRTCE